MKNLKNFQHVAGSIILASMVSIIAAGCFDKSNMDILFNKNTYYPDAEVNNLVNCPNGTIKDPNLNITVVGNEPMVYYSYQIYHENDAASAQWTGRINHEAAINLGALTINKDGNYIIKARGVNAIDRWQDEADAYTATFRYDTTAPNPDDLHLDPGTDNEGDVVSEPDAKANLENILHIYTRYESASNYSLIKSDGSSINNTGTLMVRRSPDFNPLNNPMITDTTEFRYLFVDAGDTAVGIWSAPVQLTDAIVTIPASALTSDGIYGVYFVLGDAVGNWSGACVTPADRSGTFFRRFEFDKTPPVLATTNTDALMSGLPAAISSRTSLQVTLSALTGAQGKPAQTGGTAIATYSYDLDSAGYSADTPLATPISEAGLGIGMHTIEIRIKDQAGNESAPFIQTWTIDTSAVIARFDSGLPGAYAATFDPAGIAVDADNSPAAYLWYFTTGETCSNDLANYTSGEVPMGTAISLPALAAGVTEKYSVCAVAKTTSLPAEYNNELPGNLLASDITRYTFTGDTEAPAAGSIAISGGALMSYPVGSTLNASQLASIRAAATQDIIFTASDNGAPITKYNYRIITTGTTTYTDQNMGTAIDLKAIDLPSTGDYTLRIELLAQDSLGNIGSYAAQAKVLTWQVDQTAPEVPSGITFNGAGTVDPTQLNAFGPGTAVYVVPAGIFSDPYTTLNGSSIVAYNIGRVDFDDDLTVTYTKPGSWSNPGEDVAVECVLRASANWPSTALYDVTSTLLTGEPASLTFTNVNEDGVSYYAKLRFKDAVGNWSGWIYAGNVNEADMLAQQGTVTANNIESVGLCKALIRDGFTGANLNNAWITLYNKNYPTTPLGLLKTGAPYDSGRVQALVRKGDNLYIGKFESERIPPAGNQLTGYLSAVKNNVSARPGQVLEYTLLLTPDNATNVDSLSGMIIDANDGNAIVGATFKLMLWDGSVIIEDSPMASSLFTYNNIAPGTYTIEISKVGYYTIQYDNIYLDGKNSLNVDLGRVALCGRLQEPQVRVFVQWGSTPSDLDLHLVGPTAKVLAEAQPNRFHVFWNDPNKNYNENTGSYSAGEGDKIGNRSTAALVQDNTTGYGPETINIYGLGTGYVYGAYNYSLHNYTERASTGTLEWNANNQITARIYDSQGLVLEVPFPSGMSGSNDTWRMFQINITGEGRANRSVVVKNTFVDRSTTTTTEYYSNSATNGMDW